MIGDLGRISVVGVLLLAALGVRGDSGLGVEQALDGAADISLTNVTLAEALGQISEQMGAQLDLDEAAMAKLPHGRDQQLSSVRLRGMSWRRALNELLKPLALRFQAGQERIFILGTKELLRQPRRLSAPELKALVSLQTTTLDDDEEKLLKQLYDQTGIRYGLIVGGQRKEKASKDIAKKIENDTKQSATVVLDMYCRWLAGGTDKGTWYVEAVMREGVCQGVDIIVVSKEALVELKLDRQITLEFRGRPVAAILHELGRQGTVAMSFEPGCFALLEEDVRENSTLVLRSGTIRSALEALAGMTGLEYEVTEQGVTIRAGAHLQSLAVARQGAALPKKSPLMCLLTTRLPGTDIETMILLREEDLAEQGLAEAFERMREQRVHEFIRFLRMGEDVD